MHFRRSERFGETSHNDPVSIVLLMELDEAKTR